MENTFTLGAPGQQLLLGRVHFTHQTSKTPRTTQHFLNCSQPPWRGLRMLPMGTSAQGSVHWGADSRELLCCSLHAGVIVTGGGERRHKGSVTLSCKFTHRRGQLRQRNLSCGILLPHRTDLESRWKITAMAGIGKSANCPNSCAQFFDCDIGLRPLAHMKMLHATSRR